MAIRRWIWLVAVIALALAAALAAGSVVAGQFRSPDPGDVTGDLATGEVRRVADIAAVDGLSARGVFVQVTEMGQACVFDAVSASARQRGGGCNAADDPLGGSALSVSLSYEGGPALESVRDARLIGLTAADVAAAEILMSDGTRRSLSLRPARIGAVGYQAFGLRLRRSDLRAGVGPVAVVALDERGREVARQPTGIGR